MAQDRTIGGTTTRELAFARALPSRRRANLIFNSVTFGVLLLGGIVMLVPFEWMIATSLSRAANIGIPFPPRFIPGDPSLFNYQLTLQNVPMPRYYLNTIVVAGTVTLVQLVTCSMAGYAFSKGRFVGKSVLFLILLATIMIPFEVRMIPQYLMIKAWGLNNNLLGLILPNVGSAFGVFLLTQYMRGLPLELVEASRIDGAGEVRIYWQIMLPLSGPPLAALAILAALGQWNSFLWPLLVISKRELFTITLGMGMFQQQFGAYAGNILAAATMAVLPIMILFVFLQRYIIQGIALSGLRGAA